MQCFVVNCTAPSCIVREVHAGDGAPCSGVGKSAQHHAQGFQAGSSISVRSPEVVLPKQPFRDMWEYVLRKPELALHVSGPLSLNVFKRKPPVVGFVAEAVTQVSPLAIVSNRTDQRDSYRRGEDPYGHELDYNTLHSPKPDLELRWPKPSPIWSSDGQILTP
eukprot:scaffold842_cov227-Pinguiococcus_pyrenoidosus.AAC.15